jgi:hypothetical protein
MDARMIYLHRLAFALGKLVYIQMKLLEALKRQKGNKDASLPDM